MECWRWIPGYEGLYQVSTRGRVRSVDRWVIDTKGRKQFRKGRILKTTRNQWGYLSVGLHRNGKWRHYLVHRLVAETWLDNPEGKPQVNHLDEDKSKSNNEVYNLSWSTAKENSNWGTRNKRIADSMLNGKRSKAVQAIDPKTGQVVLEFPSTAEAQRKGFDSRHISACCRGEKKYKSHKGLIWRYKD